VPKPKMHLVGYFLVPASQHQGMWRHPYSDNGWLNRSFYEDAGRAMERGLFDIFFMPDTISVARPEGDDYSNTLRAGLQSAIQLDPLQVLAVVAGVTKHIGLGVTQSTPYAHPYSLARSLASLDHLSGGRACWNVVTSGGPWQAANFGGEPPRSRDERYDEADEFLEICDALWRSWDSDALQIDKASGYFADPSKVHQADYKGKYLSSMGPLSVPRTPQGRPVLLQAGSSPRGRKFAARWAEGIFTLQHDLESMRTFRDDMRARVADEGRSPDSCKVLPAVQVVVGETDSIAQERAELANSLVDPEGALSLVSIHLGVDVSGYDLNTPLPDLDMTNGTIGSLDVIKQAAAAGAKTLADIARGFGVSEQTPQIVGSPASVADQLEHLFLGGGADGFILTPVHMPGSYDEFARAVVPELQRREIFRTEYDGKTLRDLLGLPRP
jgi:FMN-dependent oxidoreductase (nitrilotriacetate monooxygenase family)